MNAAGEDLSRVTVISPTRRIDLALPGGTTLGEIMPNILRFSGYDGGSAADVVHTWVLQRFGEDPLDPTRQIGELDIRDGETLHLRQLEAAMPDVAFDDVVDAVASSTSSQPRWKPKHSVTLALLVACSFVIGPPAVLLFGGGGLGAALITIGLSLATGLAAVLCSRAFGKLDAATACAWMSVVLAALGGFFLIGDGSTAIKILTASSAVLVLAGVMALASRVSPFHFLSIALVALVVVAAEVCAVIWPGQDLAVASIGLAIMLGVTPYFAPASYRLARIAMPNLPSSAEALMSDETPVQSDIVERAVMADKLLAAFLAASSIASVLATIEIFSSRTWFAVALTGCAGIAMLLRARSFVGLGHRLPLLISGTLIALGTVALALSMIDQVPLRLVLGLVICLALTTILVSYAANFADKILAPTWGRTGDIIEWLAIIAIIPLVLAVMDMYTRALGIAG